MTNNPTITDLLVAARGERSAQRSRQLFELALAACDSNDSAVAHGRALLKAQTLAEIALEESKGEDRTKRWLEAIKSLSEAWKESPIAEIADVNAAISVDCFQDLLSDMEFAERLKLLRKARDMLDTSLKQKDQTNKAFLLARKSSVLRHLSYGDPTPEGRISRLDEAVACGLLSVNSLRMPAGTLELAQAQWQRARYENTDERYVSRLRLAEEQFSHPILSEEEIAHLALARFYRLTFRQLDACKVFPRLNPSIKNTRRLLRESYVYAEAAIQLWYADYPAEIVEPHLQEARSLLETAIAAGYHNARLISDLAYVVAIVEGPEAGTVTLSEICGDQNSISWEEALRLIAETDITNPLAYTLALGIDQAPVWTILGTFVRRFLQDDDLAELFYRTALKIDAHNPIALTNLARFLARSSRPNVLPEAERLIQKAQAFADRRFTWWRAVQTEISELRSGHKKHRRAGKRILYSQTRFTNQKEVRDRYLSVEGVSDPQQRGYELEKLVYELARLTFDTAAPPYRIVRNGGQISQIDGFFTHQSDKYRVECKWTSERIDHNEVVIFKDKLDVVGVSGLLISISGFTESAIARAREYRSEKAILLMDGEEARFIFSGQINFDEAIRRKRIYFDQRSDPYFRIGPVTHLV